MPVKYPDLPTTVKEARRLKTVHYLSKKPCKDCGECYLRYTNSGRCVACYCDKNKEFYQKNKEAHAQAMKEWRKNHPGYYAEYWKKNPRKGISQTKYANKHRLDPKWSAKDDEILGDLLVERRRLEKETGFRWVIVLVGTKTYKAANLVLVQSNSPRWT
jgi:hypothetical protein